MGKVMVFPQQLVFVGIEVVGVDAPTGVVMLDVEQDPFDYRRGFVWIGDRRASVFQRYPGNYPFEFGWVLSHWMDVV